MLYRVVSGFNLSYFKSNMWYSLEMKKNNNLVVSRPAKIGALKLSLGAIMG